MSEEQKQTQQPDERGEEVSQQSAKSKKNEAEQIKADIKQYLQQHKMAFLIMLLAVVAIIIVSVGYKKYNWFNDYEIAIIIVTLICGTGIIGQRFDVAENLSKKQIKQLDKNMVANLANIIALAVFIYCFFEKEVLLAYIIGIVLIIINISSMVKTFLSKDSALKKLLPFDIIVPLVIGICLLWLLEDEKLQDIATTIVASHFGGFLTLVGVAWTIKRQDEIRKEDIAKREEERKQEEIAKAKPFFSIKVLMTAPKQQENNWCRIKVCDDGCKKIPAYAQINNSEHSIITLKKFYFEKWIEISENNVILNNQSVILFFNTHKSADKWDKPCYLMVEDILGNKYYYKVMYKKVTNINSMSIMQTKAEIPKEEAPDDNN